MTDFYDYLALILRYGAAFVCMVSTIFFVVTLCVMVDHHRWTHRIVRNDALNAIQALLLALVSLICFACTF